MKKEELQNPAAEAGIIATLISYPDLYFSNDSIDPHHFYNKENGYLFYAISELIKRDIKKIDIYNILNILEANKFTIGEAKNINQDTLSEIFNLSENVVRNTSEEYNLIAQAVIEMSMRRDVYDELKKCEAMICNDKEENIQSKIYASIEAIVSNYQDLKPLKLTCEKIDEIWSKIERKAEDGDFVDFNLSVMNKFATHSKTDCIVIAANEKRGKSLLLMNEMIYLLSLGKKVLYIDTELDTDLFTMRCVSHLAQVEFYKIQKQILSKEEREKIKKALVFLKEHPFIHEYYPVLTADSLISLAKQSKHKFDVDFVIVDYLKSNNEFSMDAYKNSAYMGKMVDVLKNIIAGKEKMFTITAVQANPDGTIADSKKIARNCSALFYLERKNKKQFSNDGGEEFGNTIIKCVANRNGKLSRDGEYESLTLDGDLCTWRVPKQPERIEKTPY